MQLITATHNELKIKDPLWKKGNVLSDKENDIIIVIVDKTKAIVIVSHPDNEWLVGDFIHKDDVYGLELFTGSIKVIEY